MLCIESFPDTALRGPDDAVDGLPWRCVGIAGRHPSILKAAQRREVNLAIWDRERPAGLDPLTLWPLIAAGPFVATAEGAPESLDTRLFDQLPARSPPALMRDVIDLATVFALFAPGGLVRVRLAVVTTRSSPLWHADDAGLRLLCTYYGPGTEWLLLDGGAQAASSLVATASAPCGTPLPTGAVAILKGERYPANRGAGCIHRSPHAGPGAASRLLLSIEPVEEDDRDGNG